MDKIADTLRIEVLGDSSDAISGIEKLIATLERIKGVTSGSNKGLNSSQKCLDKLAEVADKIDSGSITKIYKLANGLKTLNEVGNLKLSSKTADRIWDLGVAVDSLKGVDMSKLTELATGLSALGGVGNVSIPKGLGSIANTNAKAPVSSAFGEDVRIDPSTVTDTSDRLDGLNAKISESGSRWSSYANTATKALSNVKSGTAKLGSVAGKVFSNLTSKLSKNVRLVQLQILYRVVDRILSLITSSFKEGIDAVYQYSKALGGSFAKSLDTLAASFNYLKGSLGAMAAPLIVTLTPAIEWIIDKFVDLLNIINQVFARLSGASTWTKATKVATEYAAAADDATAANKRLKKSLLGIDEINALTDNSTNTSGGSSSTNDNAGYAFTEVPLDNTYVDGIIDKLKDILWYVGAIGLGMLAWDIGKALAKAGIGSSPIALATGLMLTVTGLVIEVKGLISIISEGINWQNFLETVGGGAVVIAGGALIGKAFGSSILGAAIGAIVAGVPMYIVGIWDAIKEGLNWLSAALIGTGATLAGAGIGAIIGLCGGPIGAGIGALIGLAVGLLTDLVILIVQNWDSVVAWCSQALSDIGQFFVNLWNGICNVWSVVAEWFDTHVIQPIVNLFSPAIEWFSQLFGSIWQTVSDVFYNIGVIASGCWEIIKTVWGIASEWFNEKVIQPVAGVFSILWNGFVEKAKKAWQGVKEVFSAVAKFFSIIFSKAWQAVVKVFSIGGEIFVDIKDGIVSAFKFVVNGIIKGLNKVVSVPFKGINAALNLIRNIEIFGLKPFDGLKPINVPQIPLLADGGIVNAGQMFIARESGAELVGNIGRQTAVMNNDQIVESVSQGVADANAEQNALLREEISILRKILDKDVPYSPYGGARSTVSDIVRKNRRDGKTVIPVGV